MSSSTSTYLIFNAIFKVQGHHENNTSYASIMDSPLHQGFIMVTKSKVFKRYKCFKATSTRLWDYEQGLHQVQARALHVCGFHDPRTLSSTIWTKLYHVQECKVTNQQCMGSKVQTTTTTTNQETTLITTKHRDHQPNYN